MTLSNHLRANLGLLLCSIVWGTTFVAVQDALHDSSVMMFLAVRFSAAAVLIALVYRKSLRRLDWQGFRAGTLVGLFMFGGYLFQTIGLQFTTASKAAFLTGSSVVLVPVILVVAVSNESRDGSGRERRVPSSVFTCSQSVRRACKG